MDLISAIKKNNLEVATALLEKGANVYARDRVTYLPHRSLLVLLLTIISSPLLFSPLPVSLVPLLFTGHAMKIIPFWLHSYWSTMLELLSIIERML